MGARPKLSSPILDDVCGGNPLSLSHQHHSSSPFKGHASSSVRPLAAVTMPERRLSRLFKAKLLRRSSTPAVPKPGKADPRAHPNSTSRTSCAPQLFDSASDKSPYSLVSSAADHSSDDIGPSPGSDHYCQEGHKHKHKHRPQTDPQPSTRSSQPKDHVQHRHASEETSSTPPPPGPSFSPLHTPFSEDSPSPSKPPCRLRSNPTIPPTPRRPRPVDQLRRSINWRLR